MRIRVIGRHFNPDHWVFAEHGGWRPVVAKPRRLICIGRSDGGLQRFAGTVLKTLQPASFSTGSFEVVVVDDVTGPTSWAVMEFAANGRWIGHDAVPCGQLWI